MGGPMNFGAAADPTLGWFLSGLVLAIVILVFVSLWRVFAKAGKPGWGNCTYL